MNALPDPAAGQLWLVITPHGFNEILNEFTARLASRGSVRVLDGGNCFNAYQVSRILAHSLSSASSGSKPGHQPSDLHTALERIHVARAFTCYQVHTLLAETPCSPHPTLVLDLLSTFYDESVTLNESQRLVNDCLYHLRRLSEKAPVVVSTRPHKRPINQMGDADNPDRSCLLEKVRSAVHQVIGFYTPSQPDRQLRFDI